jgi:hypothetical protein
MPDHLSDFAAGVGHVSINPPLPADPQGFVRRAVAVREYGDPLEVRALALQSGGASVILMTADVTGLDWAFADAIREQVALATGTPQEAVLLNSSHSHAALWPRADGKLHGETPDWTPGERTYMERLPYDFATAALLAVRSMRPARVSGATGHVSGLAVNRRERHTDGSTILGWNRDGFVDEDVPTIRIDALDGNAIATIVGFGCHPVCLGGEVELTGSDFIGPLRRQVELLRGGMCLFFQGAAGNVLPLEAFHTIAGPETSMGNRLGLEAVHCVADADPVERTIDRIEYGSVTPIALYRRRALFPQPLQTIDFRRRLLRLPLLEPPSAAEMQSELESRLSDYETLRNDGAGRDVLNPIGYHVSWLESMLARLQDGPLPRYLDGEVWAARIGDVAVVGAPGELFTEIGYEVRSRSPFKTTVFAGYSQAVLGYVATPEEYPFGGYEPTVAQRGYGHPAPFSPDVAGMLVEECVGMLNELASQV